MLTMSYVVLTLLVILNVRGSRLPRKLTDSCDNVHLTKSNATTECDYNEHDHTLICMHGIEEKWKSGDEKVRTLVLCHWPEEKLDPQSILRGFPALRKFVISEGNLTKLISPFPSELQSLEKLNITGTKLKELPKQMISNLTNLKVVDLRNNDLTNVPLDSLDSPSLHHVHLSGNPLRCTEDTTWILESRKGSVARKITDKDKLLCAAPFEGRPLVPVVEIIKTLKMECTRTVCDCELVYVVGGAGKYIQKELMAFASVNCSYRDLTEMPSFLPANTTTLYLTGNKIKDLSPLTTNPAYKGVIDLHLNENLIESVVQLEGSNWLEHFRLLNLRGNKLSDLPTYALENVLLHSGNAARLFLGNNPWTCDCLFTPGFQDLLVKYTNLVKDINDVRCSSSNGDDNSGKQIRDLTRTEICMSTDEDPLLHPLDVLNIILASLIFLVLGKLLYDYWSFKKTGKLPWIVAKIP